MPIQAILFDIDGTLVDSNDFHVLAWDEAMRGSGHEIDRQELHDHIGMGGDNYVPALVPGASKEEAERLGEVHGRIYKAYLPQVRPFPGARDLLQRCKDEGLKVALASSASGEELDFYLRLLECDSIIDAHTSADDVRASKPSPDIFEAARGKLGAPAADTLVVGDTPFDIAAARGAGIRTVAVRSGGFTDEALKDASAIYDDVATLLARFDASPLSRIEEAV